MTQQIHKQLQESLPCKVPQLLSLLRCLSPANIRVLTYSRKNIEKPQKSRLKMQEQKIAKTTIPNQIMERQNC